MATTTTNYGFDVPTSSDLVKNGATAISTLGQDIDTFLFRPLTNNAVVNGAMTNWQRGTSFTATGYTADRWYLQTSASANTVSRSTDAPSGFPYSLKWDFAGTSPLIATYIELPITGVKGQYTGTWTVSFWAKGSTTFNMNFEASFNNGSNRVDNVAIGSPQTVAATTTWTKYSYTLDLTSPTINANNKAIQLIFYSSSGTASMYLTGVQFEQGSQATPFSLAGGTIQGELAACQRYYFLQGKESLYGVFGQGIAYSTTQAYINVVLPIKMRTTPSTLDYSTVAGQGSPGGSTLAGTVLVINPNNSTSTMANLTLTVGSALWTNAYPATLLSNNSTSGYVGFSAEL
jgi:hypothetical protein